MSGIILFLVFQVPTPSVLLIDCQRDFVSRHYYGWERIGAYYGNSPVLELDKEKAHIFKFRWQAEIKAQEIRNILNQQDSSHWVRPIPIDKSPQTFYEKRSHPIGSLL